MTATVSNMTAIMKTIYPNGVPMDLVYKDHPFLALLPKKENFEGENLKLPLKYGGNSGRSATFTSAQNNASYVKTKAFTLTRNADYAYATVSNELYFASKNNPGAFIDALKLEMDGAIIKLSQSLATALYGDGSGVVARPAASVTLASTTLTLRDPENIVFFEEGDVIQFADAATGGSVRSGSLTIAGVNRSTGVLTTTQNISTGIAAATVNDYIVISGDYDSKLKGLAAWLPYSSPSATAFFGVDRTVDTVRLSGSRADYSALPIEEALISAAKDVNLQGGRPDYCFMSYENFANLCKALGSKVQYVDQAAFNMPSVSFRGVQVNTGRGVIKVIPDVYAPSDYMFLCQMDSMALYSLGKCPRIFDTDGQVILRVSNADSLELRAFYYAQLGVAGPGFCGTFKIS